MEIQFLYFVFWESGFLLNKLPSLYQFSVWSYVRVLDELFSFSGLEISLLINTVNTEHCLPFKQHFHGTGCPAFRFNPLWSIQCLHVYTSHWQTIRHLFVWWQTGMLSSSLCSLLTAASLSQGNMFWSAVQHITDHLPRLYSAVCFKCLRWIKIWHQSTGDSDNMMVWGDIELKLHSAVSLII